MALLRSATTLSVTAKYLNTVMALLIMKPLPKQGNSRFVLLSHLRNCDELYFVYAQSTQNLLLFFL